MFTRILTSSLLFLIAIGGFFVSVQDHRNIGIQGVSACNYSNPAPGDLSCPAGITASNTSNAPKPSEAESKWLNEGIQAVNAALGILTVIVSPAIIFAGWLMSPDWTTGDLFGLREPMHAMWVIVSNIVYFIYAILLIIIALATIFGKENFSYKSMIPKLALGILMVPFTWWFVQWTISLATVVTASVISIPMDIIKEDNKYVNGNYIPLTYTTTTDASGKSSTKDSAEERSSTKKCTGEIGESDGITCTSMQKILSAGGGMYSPLLIYAYQVFRLQDYKSIDGTLNQIKTGGQLLNQLLIGAIMFIVFGLLVMALIAMLLLRAIKLWMYAIFSPIFTLHFVAGKELFGKSTEGFDLKEFIGLCFVPAVVGLTLSFGLMIISVVGDSKSTSATCTSIEIADLQTGEGGCTVLTLFGNSENKIIRGVHSEQGSDKKYSVTIIKMAGLTHIYKGSATNANTVKDSAESIKGGLDAAGGIFGTIIIDIIALIFIWMAFMAAKGISKAVDAAVSPFEEMGKSVGKMAMSAPKYAPLPIPGGSLAGAGKAVSQLESIKEQAMDKRYRESDLGKLVQSMDPSSKLSDELNTAAIRLKTDSGDALAKGLKKVLDESTGKQLIYNRTIQDGLESAISKKPSQEALEKAGFSNQHAKKMIEVMNDSNLNADEKKILLAAIAKSGTPSTITIGKGEVSKWKATLEGQGGTNSSTGGTSGSTAASGFASRPQGADHVNITLGDKIIQANIKVNESTLNDAEKKRIVKELNGVKSGMKKDDFIKGLLLQMKKDAAIELAEALDKNDDFFIK